MPIATNQVTITDLNDGQNGQTSYVHIAYATNATGTAGFSTTDATNKTYMGTYTDFIATDSTDPTKYTWSLIKGDKGDPGSQGVQGPAGPAGQILYTWVKYADSPTTGMSDSPTGKAYIGLAYNKTTATESTVYSDYSWSLIKGDTGNQGVQGPAGTNGQTTYTWVKYADDASGAGMSDSPTGKRFLGLAYNKTTVTESTAAGDYSWSPLYDNVSVGGRNLLRDSNRTFNTASYNITTYPLVNPPAEGEQVTISLKGQLGADRDYFGIYNSGGNVSPTQLTPAHRGADGIYRRTFNWRITQGAITASNTYLSLYHMVSTDTTASTVEWIKLERGNVATDFSLAPEDVDKGIKDVEGIATGVRDKLTPLITPNGLLIGTKLAPNTVTATSLAIGDFTNMVMVDEITNTAGNATVTVNNNVYFKIGTSAYSRLVVASSATKDFKVGTYFFVGFNGYKDSVIQWSKFTVRYYYSDGTSSDAGQVDVPFTTADSIIELQVPITAEPVASKTLSNIMFFVEKDNTTTGSLYVRSIELRTMNKGNLIVDGTITGKTINGGRINSALIKNSWTDSATEEAGYIEIATKAKGSNTPQLTVSYDSPGVTGKTELYGFGMRIKAMGYDLIFNNFASTMGIDAYNNDLRMGSSRGLKFFPDWNGTNAMDLRHFYMKVEQPTVTYYGGTPKQERVMVMGVADDYGDANTTGGTMAIRSGSGYVLVQPEFNNPGNNTFAFTIQESTSSSLTHGLLSFGSTQTQNAMKSALKFRKDTAEIQAVDTTNSEGSSTMANFRADRIYGATFDLTGQSNARIGTTTDGGGQTYISSPNSNFLRLQDSTVFTYAGKQIQFASSTVIHKTNVRPIESVDFDPILTLKTVPIFEYHSLFDIENGDYFKKRIGVLREAVPEFMRDETTVDHWSMLGALWQVSKVQQDSIEELQSDVADLKEVVTEQQAQIDELKAMVESLLSVA